MRLSTNGSGSGGGAGVIGSRQAIIISGESGAGKTEATKKCLQYLSAAVQSDLALTALALTEKGEKGEKGKKGIEEDEGKGGSTDHANQLPPIEDRVLGTNPLLESLGNAKTIRNNNSSRFGKWLEINFTPAESISHAPERMQRGSSDEKRWGSESALLQVRLEGAKITEYLLEKSRVVTQGPQERNYHLFYQLCAPDLALPAALAEQLSSLQIQQQSEDVPLYDAIEVSTPQGGQNALGLYTADHYQYLNQGGAGYTIDGVDDAADFLDTAKAFQSLQFSTDQQTGLFSAVKAIICLGNVQFESADITATTDAGGSGRRGAMTTTTGGDLQNADGAVTTVRRLGESSSMLSTAAALLGLSVDALARALTSRALVVREELLYVGLDVPQAVQARDALSKEVYGRLFSFVVRTINESLSSDSDSSNQSKGGTEPGPSSTTAQASDLAIGLLDIFGFEVFDHNGFEQLCINYANEKLQQYVTKISRGG